MSLLRALIILHPIHISLIYILALVVLTVSKTNEIFSPFTTQLQAFAWAALFFLPLGWSIGVYSKLSEGAAEQSKKMDLVFSIISSVSLIYSLLIFFLSLFFSESVGSTNIGIEVFISFINIAGFFCIPATFWMTSQVLVKTEDQVTSRPRYILLTFMQIAYFPIGIYWLSKRISRVEKIKSA